MVLGLLKRELSLVFKRKHEAFFMITFFVFCGFLFPFALGTAPETLSRYGAGIIWLLTIFTLSLSLRSFFLGDELDGSLDQLKLQCGNASGVFLLKAVTHCLILIPLILCSAWILSIAFSIPSSIASWLLGSVAVSLPGFIFISGTISALSLQTNLPVLVKPLLLFPLYIPLLIFGIGVTEALLIHQPCLAFFKILIAVSLLIVVISAFLAGKILE